MMPSRIGAALMIVVAVFLMTGGIGGIFAQDHTDRVHDCSRRRLAYSPRCRLSRSGFDLGRDRG